MKRLAILVAFAIALAGAWYLLPRSNQPEPDRTVDPETSVVRYLEASVKPGQPVEISRLRKVFTSPEERRAVDRLFGNFMKIPLTVVQFESAHHRLPTLDELSEQFDFKVPGEMALMLRIFESDPRIFPFFQRDPATGQITKVDADAVRADRDFGRFADYTLSGLEGKPAPGFSLEAFGGGTLESTALNGQPHLVYFWFSNCPPCVKTAPMLARLHAKYSGKGLKTIAANADRILELKDTDNDRDRYLKSSGMDAFSNAHLTTDMQEAYGGVLLYPTFVLVNRQGTIVKQLASYQEESVLEAAILEALKP